MREHMGLFRGKRQDNGEWVEGSLWVLNDRTLICKRQCGARFCLVDPNTIGECTGLRDKNGKLIFEGDIFRFPDEVWLSYYTSCGTEYSSWEVENYGVVGFCEDLGRFDFIQYKFDENSVEADLHENREMEFYEFVSKLEIIGDIHDHPELLEGGEGNGRNP